MQKKFLAIAAVAVFALAACGNQESAAQNTTINGCEITPNTQCEGADLKDAYLFNADLSGANLKGADLSGANMQGANLSGANLEGAKLNDTIAQQVNFEGANVTGMSAVNTNLIHATCPGGELARNNRCVEFTIF